MSCFLFVNIPDLVGVNVALPFPDTNPMPVMVCCWRLKELTNSWIFFFKFFGLWIGFFQFVEDVLGPRTKCEWGPMHSVGCGLPTLDLAHKLLRFSSEWCTHSLTQFNTCGPSVCFGFLEAGLRTCWKIWEGWYPLNRSCLCNRYPFVMLETTNALSVYKCVWMYTPSINKIDHAGMV